MLELAHTRALTFVEVGSFEGRSAAWLLQNVLVRADDRLICIDVFDARYDWIFDANIQEIGGTERIEKRRGLSHLKLRELAPGSADAVYIDASHTIADTIRDAVLAWDVLRPGGLLIFDDYAWHDKTDPDNRPQYAIDAFLVFFQRELDVKWKGYQVIVRKR